jgi:hypothetical protein
MSTPRKVDPYVYVAEWIWRHSKATGIARYVLLRIGRVMRWTSAGFETPPVPVEEIARDTHLADSTVRKHLAALGAGDGDLEIVMSTRRGEAYRYRLRREQRLPLPDLAPAPSHRRMAAVTPPGIGDGSPPNGGGDTAEWRRSHRYDAAVTPPNGGGDSAGDPFSFEVVRTEVLVPSTTTKETAEAAADLADDVREFLTWWRAAYPLYNRGARTSVDVERDWLIVATLRAVRTLFRLQEMAIVLWLVDVREEPWIADSDRGLRVLRHKADWLDRRVVELPAWWHACAHPVKCSSARECAVPAEARG